jgi:hypothetical protein
MPRPKQLIKPCEVETARARRTCAFSNAAIFKGIPCLVVHDGYRDRSCYSREIALRMIRQARERLDEVEEQLGAGPCSPLFAEARWRVEQNGGWRG